MTPPLTAAAETKGFDPLAEIKAAAAERWDSVVNTDGQFGRWDYRMVRSVGEVRPLFDQLRPPRRAES